MFLDLPDSTLDEKEKLKLLVTGQILLKWKVLIHFHLRILWFLTAIHLDVHDVLTEKYKE